MPSAIPTFRSGSTGSLYWGATYGGRNQRCESQGKTVVQDLQDGIVRFLRAQAVLPILENSVATDSINALPVQGSDIHSDGEFDGYTMLGLYAMLAADTFTPPAMRDAVIADWNSSNTNPQDSSWSPIIGGSRAFSPLTIKAIIWKSQHPDLDPQFIYIDPATIGPQYEVAAIDDGDANGDVTCAAAPIQSDADVSSASPDMSQLFPSTPGNVAARGVSASTASTTPRSYPLIASGNSTAATNMSTAATVGVVAGAVGLAALVTATIVAFIRRGKRGRR